jgi:hypothetical protein
VSQLTVDRRRSQPALTLVHPVTGFQVAFVHSIAVELAITIQTLIQAGTDWRYLTHNSLTINEIPRGYNQW